jgi:hypothetical protein
LYTSRENCGPRNGFQLTFNEKWKTHKGISVVFNKHSNKSGKPEKAFGKTGALLKNLSRNP